MLLMAVVAILLAWLLGRGFQLSDTSPPWWLDTPAVVGFYSLLWKVYDRLLWKSRPFGKPVSDIPDYSGTWSGGIHSSFRPDEPYPATLRIHQTSSRILIELATGQSQSYSRLAMIGAAPGPGHGLHYVYVNEPTQKNQEIRHHEGSATLQLSQDGKTLAGNYFTDIDRGTAGALIFTKVKDSA
ncbi:Uncharacterised protein [Amycolatopsis camponoti]|uniref:CD-NTase-associated protein 15 domain-containing protein n=1 Tax=Amycolatopsis camponoti TaxID=2606593 RepID=A0A6I8LWV5_9PSEU|nr:Uncharacterised protein [Amycolatopsis camponoti]